MEAKCATTELGPMRGEELLIRDVSSNFRSSSSIEVVNGGWIRALRPVFMVHFTLNRGRSLLLRVIFDIGLFATC